MARFPRFFDEHLVGIDTGLRAEKPIHYFTVHEERGRGADVWPPIPEATRYFLAENGTLAQAGAASDQTSDQDTYDVDFSTRTGQFTRYERIAAIDSRQYYTDLQGRDGVMLNYTSSALPQDAELTGHCEVSLWLSSNATDFAVHAYISEILPDGTSCYVTEGLLRALHRKESAFSAPLPDVLVVPFMRTRRCASQCLSTCRNS